MDGRLLLGLGAAAGLAGGTWWFLRREDDALPPPGPATVPGPADYQRAVAAEPAIRDAAIKAQNAMRARKRAGLPVYGGIWDLAMGQQNARDIRLVFLADRIGLAPRDLDAVMTVESGGKRWDLLRFEPHRFVRARPDLRGRIPYHPSNTDPLFKDRTDTGSWSYRRSETNRAAFDRAAALDPVNAVAATSFGAFQVMGWALLPEGLPGPGPASSESALAAIAAFDNDPMAVSERMLARWIEANPDAKQAAKVRNWVRFASIYNGAGKAEKYGRDLAQAWARSTLPAYV